MSADTATRAAERLLEEQVSRYIGAMPCLFLAVDDDPGPTSMRGYIERNSIGLLSADPSLDPPSFQWLGRHCPREKVRQSGLWNQNHVSQGYESQFLDTLD